MMKRDEVARLRPVERKALVDELARMVRQGELGLGDAARILRKGLLGMDRASFAKAVGVSPRALAKLEDDPEANPTLHTLRRVFKPLGARVGLVFAELDEEGRSGEDEGRRGALLAMLEGSRHRRG